MPPAPLGSTVCGETQYIYNCTTSGFVETSTRCTMAYCSGAVANNGSALTNVPEGFAYCSNTGFNIWCGANG